MPRHLTLDWLMVLRLLATSVFFCHPLSILSSRGGGADLAVATYAGNGSSFVHRVCLAQLIDVFRMRDTIHHYLCTDYDSVARASRLGDALYAKAEVQLVGFEANLRQDVKLLKCVRAIMEPAVLLLMDDWWIKYPPDIDALLHFARIVGASTPASARISAVRLACSERKYLSFGGLRTPAKGLYAILDQPLQPSIWNRTFLENLIRETIDNTNPPAGGRQRLEYYTRVVYAKRQQFEQGNNTFDDDRALVVIMSGAPYCTKGREVLSTFHAIIHGHIKDKQFGPSVCALSPRARVYLKELLKEVHYQSRHHYFPFWSCSDEGWAPFPYLKPNISSRDKTPWPMRHPCCSDNEYNPNYVSNCEPPPWTKNSQIIWSVSTSAGDLGSHLTRSVDSVLSSTCCWTAQSFQKSGFMQPSSQNNTIAACLRYEKG